MSCNCVTTLPLRRLLCRAPYKQPWLLWCPVPGIMLRICRHLTARLGRRCQHHPHGTDKAPTPSPSGASSSHSGETEGTCPHAELSGCSWLTGPAPPLPRPSTAPPRGSAHSSSRGQPLCLWQLHFLEQRPQRPKGRRTSTAFPAQFKGLSRMFQLWEIPTLSFHSRRATFSFFSNV